MKKVVFLLPLSREYERGLLQGIAQYSKIHGPWAHYMVMPDYSRPSRLLSHLKQLNPDGFVIRIPFSIKTDQLLPFDKPIIVVDITKPADGFPSIEPDCKVPATLTTDYFWGKGYSNFAFIGFQHSYWCQQRGYYLEQALAAKKQLLHKFHCNVKSDNMLEEVQDALIRWLVGLPKPVAILTTNCDLARHVLEACKIADIPVPEQAAVLGIDNDSLVCQLSSPTLSSIAYNFEQTGYEAAQLLDQLMKGHQLVNPKLAVQKIIASPTHIITRESTDREIINDVDIANALSFIRQNSKQQLQVDDVAEAVGIPRRSLERKFRKMFDRSIYTEIIHVRMKHAAQMLCETNLSMTRIAYEFQYNEERFFSRCFKSVLGMSPSQYRKRFGKMIY